MPPARHGSSWCGSSAEEADEVHVLAPDRALLDVVAGLRRVDEDAVAGVDAVVAEVVPDHDVAGQRLRAGHDAAGVVLFWSHP